MKRVDKVDEKSVLCIFTNVAVVRVLLYSSVGSTLTRIIIRILYSLHYTYTQIIASSVIKK